MFAKHWRHVFKIKMWDSSISDFDGIYTLINWTPQHLLYQMTQILNEQNYWNMWQVFVTQRLIVQTNSSKWLIFVLASGFTCEDWGIFYISGWFLSHLFLLVNFQRNTSKQSRVLQFCLRVVAVTVYSGFWTGQVSHQTLCDSLVWVYWTQKWGRHKSTF